MIYFNIFKYSVYSVNKYIVVKCVIIQNLDSINPQELSKYTHSAVVSSVSEVLQISTIH